jgi:hypothetical protein
MTSPCLPFACIVKDADSRGASAVVGNRSGEFLGCLHATYLDLRDLTSPAEMQERDAATVLIFEKDLEHERRHLALLKGP